MAARTKQSLQRLIPSSIKGRLKRIGMYADKAHLRVYAVGGFVRDLLLKKDVLDIDIVTIGDPAPLVNVFEGKITRHARYMTYTVAFPDGSHLDFAAARKETYPQSACLPVVSPGLIDEDLRRRDFTCNAIMMGLNEDNFGEIVDPFAGHADLKKRILRVFHAGSFEDDPTRLFRAARFMGRFNMKLETKTQQFLEKAIRLKLPSKLSSRRIANEFLKILAEPDPGPALQICSRWGLTRCIHPHLPGCRWKEMAIKKRSLPVSIAWLLHGISLERAEQIIEKISPDQRTADMAASMLYAARALKNTRKIDDVTLEEFGNEDIFNIDFLKLLPWVDRKIINRLKRYRSSHSSFLNGADLHQLGFVPGKLYGDILRAIRRRVWDGSIKNRQDAIAYVKDTYHDDSVASDHKDIRVSL